ncbi:MAG: DNA polymerase IV [Pseudomonadota bacterium]
MTMLRRPRTSRERERPLPGLCRDCMARDNPVPREASGAGPQAPEPLCRQCGSARILRHSALFDLTIAHIDCDAFFAAIEKRDDPALKHKPVIVGGGQRGVVSTCCYTARLYGVRSAMPMFKALKACPDAVVIKPNFEKYAAAARKIREKMDRLSPLVEPVSIDEAYLDLSGTEVLHGASPAELLVRLAAEIECDVGITVSIGLSVNKFLAKTASELDKPRGFAVIDGDEAARLLAPRPVAALHGVGPKLAARLARDGLETVGDVQALDAKALVGRYGETGIYLNNRARGIDNRPVQPGQGRKSVSSETTFNTDVADPATLEDLLWRVCEKTAARAKTANVEGAVVTLKLKTKGFRSLTRRATLAQPTQLAQALFRAARPLLSREMVRGDAYRLIGVGLSDLSEARADDRDLLDPRIEKRAAAERAGDKARARFGIGAIQTGRALRMEAKSQKRPAKR